MRTKTAYLVHGFNVSDGGQGTIDRLQPYLEDAGYRVVQLDYGWTGLIGVRFYNRKMARLIARMAEPGSVAFGHSNGCALLHHASRFGAQFGQMVYINPALDRNAAPGARVQRLHVWHSPSDIPVKLARFIPGFAWGAMGAFGYKGPDPRVINYNKEKGYPVRSWRHSDVFEREKMDFFAPRMILELNQ